MEQEKDGRGEGTGVMVGLCVLVLTVGMVASAGLVIAILNYSRDSGTPVTINVDGAEGGYESESGYTGGATADTHYDSRIWTIQLDPVLQQRRSYIDMKNRQLRGYVFDVINAVCQIAGKHCQIVDNSHTNCRAGGMVAPGLLDRWFDACSGFSISLDRVRGAKFTAPITPTNIPLFVTLAGNPHNFDPDNLDGKKIGFIAAWWADSNCLFYITDYELARDQILTFDDIADAVQALNDGEVDSLLISEQLKAPDGSSLEVVKELPACLLGGDALMMRKDSLFKEWWDPAFDKLKSSRTYRGICSDVDDPAVHGNIPGNSADKLCFN